MMHLVLRSLFLLLQLERIFLRCLLGEHPRQLLPGPLVLQLDKKGGCEQQELCREQGDLTPPPNLRFEIEKPRDDHSLRPLCAKMGNVTHQVLPCVKPESSAYRFGN